MGEKRSYTVIPACIHVTTINAISVPCKSVASSYVYVLFALRLFPFPLLRQAELHLCSFILMYVFLTHIYSFDKTSDNRSPDLSSLQSYLSPTKHAVQHSGD